MRTNANVSSTRDEEVKLLAACDTSQRAHLKAILICALDTGMRQGEILSLRWRDVDLENGLLTIQAFHTKTMKERQVALTARVSLELERLKANASDNPNGLVFGILDNVKRSFTFARSDARITLLRARGDGRIRFFRIGTRVLYSDEHLVEFLRTCERNTSNHKQPKNSYASI